MTPPIMVRRPRALMRAWGRDPVKMIQGLATADIQAVAADRAVYTTFLTPKGRMVADARVLLRPGEHEPPELLIETDRAAAEGLVTHLRKFVPPLFARFEDVSAEWRVTGVYGDGATAAMEAGVAAAGADVEREIDADRGATENSVVATSSDPPLLVVRSLEAGGEGWDLLAGESVGDAIEAALVAAGAVAAGEADLEPFRIAAGRPRWGAELTPDVIPLEAGLLDRAISQSKGCYTGQEVIVRILHRGHVNRHLRGLTFPSETPTPGTELFEPGGDKPRGVVTSAVPGAQQDGGRGLGYVRREVQPPAELRAGSPDGPPVEVSALQ